MTSVSLSGYAQSIDGRVLQTSKDNPEKYPFVLDYNAGTPLGLGEWLALMSILVS